MDTSIQLYAVGFDSIEIMQTKIERYQPPGFGQYLDDNKLSSYPMRLDRDSPALGYSSTINTNLDQGYNYVIKIGHRITRLQDIYFEDEIEWQPKGFGEADPCYNKVHYTIDDSVIIAKPTELYHADNIIIRP